MKKLDTGTSSWDADAAANGGPSRSAAASSSAATGAGGGEDGGLVTAKGEGRAAGSDGEVKPDVKEVVVGRYLINGYVEGAKLLEMNQISIQVCVEGRGGGGGCLAQLNSGG